MDIQLTLPVLVQGDAPFLFPAPVPEGPDINLRDDDNCTPLHVAILNGQLGAMRVLLEAGARVTSRCEGSPPLQMAVCVATHPEHAAFGLPAVELLTQHGGVVLDRDDHGRTALHWAAASGLTSVAEALLRAGDAFARSQLEAAERDLGSVPSEPAPPLWEFQDKQGNTALHLAARYCHGAVLKLLLEAASPSVATAVKQRNKAGLNVAHMAAVGGDPDCVRAVLAACPAAAVSTTRQGLTAAEVAAKRGHTQAAALLQGVPAPTPPAHPPGHHKEGHTLLLAPPECLHHHTAPWPIVRGGPDPPPENVNRLTVLTKPGVGILRTVDFSGALRWDERPRRAALGDIMRVHDWAYVRKIQAVCDKLPDDPSEIGHLDGDTAISRRTFVAALAAAGAVTHAVDELVSKRARNAFCAVRPPGHHAGPHGVVTCANDPHGSHGFCLFNNVAIGAAYAMTVYRHAGVKRVAILDFDVHHGNGTEACVANTAPSVAKFAISTPYGEGMQQFPVYKPWHDVDDKDNVFFASVQGYGHKMPGVAAFVYPGSGATCDTHTDAGTTTKLEEMPPEAGENGNAGGAPSSNGGSTGGGGASTPPGTDVDIAEEDPDGEFTYSGGEMPRTEGPRIIDVGIPGPGAKVALWRRAWRDKILPALVNFDPDLIFISAGFDAHKKDEINFAYIGVQEKDFEWLTDQIVQVANRCCDGRVVSVLEGGYRIQGKVVSAFARSVAAHVRALAEANGQAWDPRDAKWEREHEKQLRAEAEAKKAAAAAEAEAARMAAAAALAAEEEAAAAAVGGDEVMGVAEQAGGDAAAQVGSAAAAPEEEEDGGKPKKRARKSVDYVALNRKLEEEAAGKGGVPE